VAELPGTVSHAQFVQAFYSTALFKLGRVLLGVFLSRPSTGAQARQLAEGQLSSFAAWSVESRTDNEIVLATGPTRSWLMVKAGVDALPASTQLHFGSAVVPPRSSSGARGNMGLVFTALLGFHKLYSRTLLMSARARLYRQIQRAAH
jgi:hypothetical protein